MDTRQTYGLLLILLFMLYLTTPFTFKKDKEPFVSDTKRINLVAKDIDNIKLDMIRATKDILDLASISKHNILRICKMNKTMTEMV